MGKATKKTREEIQAKFYAGTLTVEDCAGHRVRVDRDYREEVEDGWTVVIPTGTPRLIFVGE